MRFERLGNIVEIIGGNAAPKGDGAFGNDGLPFVKMKDLGRHHLTSNLVQIEYCVSDKVAKANRLKVIKKGNILLPRSGSVALNHRAILGTDAYMVSHICALEVKNTEEVFNQYLYYYLTTINFASITKKTTGLDAITFQDLAKVQIPLPPLPTQRHIANILSKAENLITQRKEIIRLLDEFLKSTFLEMFDKYEAGGVIKLEKISSITSGLTKGKKYNGQETRFVPYMRVANVQDGYLELSEIKEIEANQCEIERYNLEFGDLLLTEGGDPDKLGRGTIWRNEISGCIFQNHIFRVRVNDPSEINPIFLSFQTGSVYGKKYFLKSAKQTTGIASINSTQLKNFPAFVPPIKLQTQFAEIVEKTEALKAQYQQNLQELEHLYGSLSQRAFRGELLSVRPVKQKQTNISDKASLAFYQKQIIGHVVKKHQEHNMPQGEMVVAKDLYHLELLYGVKTYFQFKNWHFGTYDGKIRQLINGKDKFFHKKPVGQKGYEVLDLGERADTLFAPQYYKQEFEHIEQAMDELLQLYASFPVKLRSAKIELLNTVCKVIIDGESTELKKVRQMMQSWETPKAGFKNKADKFTEQETLEMIELIICKGWDRKLLKGTHIKA